MQTTILRTIISIHSALSPLHPLLIDGHTRDARDSAVVASRIVANVRRSRDERNVTKPPILIMQGNPITERGISDAMASTQVQHLSEERTNADRAQRQACIWCEGG